jgi:hypothetical protein
MWWMVWTSLAAAGQLVVDARVPTEVHVDGHPAVELFTAAVVNLELPPGKVNLTVYINGKPAKYAVDIPEKGSATLLVGRTGVTTGTSAAAPAGTGPQGVEFRVSGASAVMVQVDNDRHKLSPGQSITVELTAGEHRLAVRDESGTTIWARGVLAVGGNPLVVQVSEGRVPEIAGEGGIFRPDSN